MVQRVEMSPQENKHRHTTQVSVTAECDAKQYCTAELSVSEIDILSGTTGGIPDQTTSKTTHTLRVDGNRLTATTSSTVGEKALFHGDVLKKVSSGKKSVAQGGAINGELAAQVVAAAQGFVKDGISAEEVPAIEQQVLQTGKKIRQYAVRD